MQTMTARTMAVREDHSLYETAETYMALLAIADRRAGRADAQPLAIEIDPAMLEKFAGDGFKRGFERFLTLRLADARAQSKRWEDKGRGDLSADWQRRARYFLDVIAEFAALRRDIPAAMEARINDGLIERT